MDNPGSYQLGSCGNAFQLAGAATIIGSEIRNLDGMKSVSLQANFKYGSTGSGSPTATLFVQTSLDRGNTWFDIWAEEFTTSSELLAVNLNDAEVASPVTLQNMALENGQVVNGLLGDRLRAVVVVAGGVYAGGTLLDMRAVAR